MGAVLDVMLDWIEVDHFSSGSTLSGQSARMQAFMVFPCTSCTPQGFPMSGHLTVLLRRRPQRETLAERPDYPGQIHAQNG